MLVPLLNTVNSVAKLPKNTVLGSITKVENAEYVENMSSPQFTSDKAHDEAQLHSRKQNLYFQCSQATQASKCMHMTVTSCQYNCKMQAFH